MNYYESEDEFDERVNDFVDRPRYLFRRLVRDSQNPFTYYNESEFKERYRFTKSLAMFSVLPLIKEPLQKLSKRGSPISPELQLLVALRYFATGSFQIVTGDLIQISQPATSRIVTLIAKLLSRCMSQFVKFPTNLEAVKLAFYEIGNFPGVIGCIDGTHVAIKSPGGDFAELFRNRKRFFSINVQVVCGPHLEIYDIIANKPGSNHDARIFGSSRVKRRLQNKSLDGILLGDSGYPNSGYLLTPFKSVDSQVHRRYNTAQIRTRNTAERTIGVWKKKFNCLQTTMATKLETSCNIIVATAVLYNIARSFMPDLEDQLPDNDHPINYSSLRTDMRCSSEGLAFRRAFALQHFS